MNYLKIYNCLILKAKSEQRVKGSNYYENHHIKPKALGGDNSLENLVLLTGREHYIAHKLLAKIYGGKMLTAFFLMDESKNSKLYELAKSYVIEQNKLRFSGKKLSECHKSKLSEANKGKFPYQLFTLEAIEKRRIKQIGRVVSEDTKKKQSESATGRKHSNETILKIKNNRPHKGMFGKDSYHHKPIVCTTTNQKYDSITEAHKHLGISIASISLCCKGKRKSAGKHSVTGEKLIWIYAD